MRQERLREISTSGKLELFNKVCESQAKLAFVAVALKDDKISTFHSDLVAETLNNLQVARDILSETVDD